MYFSELPQDQLVSSNEAAFVYREFAKTYAGWGSRGHDEIQAPVEILGVRLWVGHANKKSNAKQNGDSVLMTPTIRRKIEALSTVNFEIYETARTSLAA
ncbi:MAG: hypothetical protein R3D28_20405 [Geminicoccaceae bacterium]